ncbi:MAG TPA: homogentisate 1,2-dioxygenase [Crenalkalicoccus sp.]|nr:homogentisate 1,2-dioxygenase [Crenalkalicoccus sp.]
MRQVTRPQDTGPGLPMPSGFGNAFATGALPRRRNPPRKLPYGLCAERFSGTAFTLLGKEARRTWFCRIRPTRFAMEGPQRQHGCESSRDGIPKTFREAR